MRREDLSMLSRLLAIVAIVAAIFPAPGLAAPVPATKSSDALPVPDQELRPQAPLEGVTPLQQALQATIEERRALLLPVPASVAYDYEVIPAGEGHAATGAGSATKIVGITTVHFDHPEQAGLARWPDVVVDDNLPPGATGTVVPGDYTQRVRDALEQAFPGIWEEYEYGYEPRSYTFAETFEITYAPGSPQASVLASPALSDSATAEQILVGFSYPGPHIDYTLEEKWQECPFGLCVTVARAKTGLEVGWDLGLRLPVEVSLNTPDRMNQGSSYWLSSAITPLDWSASDYARAGVPAGMGNEYLLEFVFFGGFKAWILGAPVVNGAIDMEYDASKSFTTPFGPGAAFPLGTVNLPPERTGLQKTFAGAASVGIGLVLEPRVGSSHITASWQAVPGSDASGSGQVTYTQPRTPVAFGPVMAADLGPSDHAELKLAGFRYWFDEFFIGLSGYLQVTLFGYPVRTGNLKIADFYLRDLMGGLWVGVHENTPGAVTSRVRVRPPLGPLDYRTYVPLVRN